MRNHTKAVLLRLSDSDFNYLKLRAASGEQSVQDFLRDVLRYGTLPPRQKLDDKNNLRKRLTA